MIPAYYLIVLMKKSHASPKWILTGRGDQYITANSEYISEKIDIIMQLANKNKMVRKKYCIYMERKVVFYPNYIK